MSYNDWGPAGAAPTLADPQGGEAADAWNTSGMRSALPNEGAHGAQPAADTQAAHIDPQGGHEAATGAADGQENATAMAEGWVDAQPYNYEAYSVDSSATWDGNARVYEYDGESGEVGPEVPELELQLFGEADNRTGHGIDFSR